MPRHTFVGEQVFFGVEPLAEFLLVDQVMEARVTGSAEVEPSGPHLGLGVSLAEPRLVVVLARNQVVKRQWLVATAKLATVGWSSPRRLVHGSGPSHFRRNPNNSLIL